MQSSTPPAQADSSPAPSASSKIRNTPPEAGFQLEDLYLKIFKYTVIAVMSIALLSVLILLPLAALSYFQTPVAPPPIQPAPVKNINPDDLKNFLIDEKKKNVLKEEQARLKAAGKEPSNTVAAANVVFDKPYESQVIPMYTCLGEFAKATDAEVVNADVTQEREQLRAALEAAADQPLKGANWITSVTAFACQVLKDQTIIQLTKDNKIGKVLGPMIRYHGTAWVNIQKEKLQFEQNQQRQFDMATAKEFARVAAAKSTALIMASVAGSAFLLFIVLALYLIFAKIENNLALIYRSIEAVKPRNSI